VIDAERLVSDWLRNDTDVAAIVDRRVVGKPPSDIGPPWVRVTLLDAPQEDTSDYSSGYYLQLDCYASNDGGQPEAFTLGRAVRAALVALARTTSELGIVSGTQINGHARVPDAALEPARERVIITATVWAH
jgi:hypothetical protein